MRSSSIIGAILLTLFGLPFLGMGLFFAFASASRGGPQAWIGVVFGLFFACIGLGLMSASIVGVRISKQQDELKAANPDKPWLWRKDWAEGRANGGDPRANITAWVFTGFWDFVSIFVASNVLPKLLKDGDPKALLVLIFPLAGVFITALAVRGTLRIWRYGRTSFQCGTVPFCPGRYLQGVIHLKLPSSIPHGTDLRLSCKRRIVTGSGNSQSVNEMVLWQDEKNIPAESVTRGFTDAEIPVDFAIPLDAYETNGDNPNDRVYWQLHAKADVPGVDFTDNYELPVFRTGATSPAVRQPMTLENSPASTIAQPQTEFPAPAPASTHVVFRDDQEGTCFYFPPLRNHGQALGVLAFAIIWSVVVYFLWTHEDAPWLFRITFSFCEILVGYMLLSVVFGSALIRVHEGMLQVRSAILGLGALQQIPFAEIASISSLSQGQANTSGEVLYGISIKKSDGREIKIAASSLTQVEVRWIVASMERAMGRKQDTRVDFQSIYGAPPQSSAGFVGAASSTILPLKFRTAQKSVGVAGFAIWLAFAGFMFARVFTGVKTVHRTPPKAEAPVSIPTTPMTDEDAARIGRLPKQQQAEELLARSIGHDKRALDMLENDVESWTSEVRLTDRMKQLDSRAEYSTDLRVRQADADLWLAMEGWHHNQEAVGLLMKRIERDRQYRPSAYYFLGMEGARGIDSEHAFAELRDAALKDPDPVVRQWAVEGLRFFKTDDALDVLFESFTHDSTYSVRDRAGCNLSDCGVFTRSQRMRLVPKLIELADDRSLNSQMRNWVFMALQEITDVSLPADAAAWRTWYKQHGAEKTAEFEALPWYEVRGER